MKNKQHDIKLTSPFSPYVEAIKDYMAETEIDYAYMLSGKWGSGKTFFIKNVLKEHLESLGYKIVYTSLYGKTSIAEVNKDFFNQIVLHKKNVKVKLRIGKSINQVISTADDLGSGIVAGMISDISSHELNRKLDDGLGEKVLFIVDDVERCNTNALGDILGAVHSQFSDNGYHVLFVAEETKLASIDEYKERKEKIIRSTINYTFSDITEVIVPIVEEMFDEPVCKLLETRKNDFLEFIKMVKKVENLRTWFSSFDYYNQIVKKCGYDISYPFLLQLYISVFLSTHFSKTNISLFDTPSYSFDKDEVTLENIIKKEFGIDCFIGFDFGKDSKLLNQYPGMIKYARIDAIVKYIQTGFLDKIAIREELDSFFPIGTPAEKALVETYHIDELSQEELEKCIDGIMQGIEDREFPLIRVIGISRLFEGYEGNGYLGLFGERFLGYQKQFCNCVENLPPGKIGSFFDENPLTECDYTKYLKQPNFLEKSVKALGEKYYNPNKTKEQFISVFQRIGDYRYYEIPSEIKNDMIKRAKEYDLFPEVLSFRCRDIAILKLYLHDISHFSNSGDHYYSEVEPLSELKNLIRDSLESIPNSKQKIDLKSLSDDIDEAIRLIRSTRSSSR